MLIDRAAGPLPEISVVMPVFNAEQYLRQAVESVLGQTFANFEFLVYDDGSTDGSVGIMQEYAQRDSRIRFFPMEHAGHVTWLNAGLHEATGEFIGRMDADDVCVPQRFERQHAFLREHADVVVVGSDFLMIDEDGEALGIGRHETEDETLRKGLLAGLLGEIAHPTSMMRRTAVLRAGGYRKRYETTEDLDLWFRLAEVGRLANIPQVLLQYRQHERSICYSEWHRQKAFVDEIVNDARARNGLPPLLGSVWTGNLNPYQRRVTWAWWALGFGSYKAVRNHARIAIALAPWRPGGWVLIVASAMPRWLMSSAARLWRLLRRSAKAASSSDAQNADA